MKPRTIRVDRCPQCGFYLRERSLEKNARLHAICTHLSKQKEWFGELRSIEQWKRILTAAYERAKGREVEIIPAIDGIGADGEGYEYVYRRTSYMDETEIRDLCVYAEAWAIEQGIDIGSPDHQ